MKGANVLRIVAALVAALAAMPANAQTYPDHPVKIVLPFGAGGVADVSSRIIAEKLGERLGQRFVIENMPGAGGIGAAQTVLAAPPNGYTLGLVTNGTAISVALFNHLPFDPTVDFEMISTLASFDLVFAVNAASPYKTLADFVAAAKVAPGKLNIGTVNIGSTQNLGAELLKGLSTVDPADPVVARFFVYSLLGADYDDSPYTQQGERVARLAVSGIRLVIEEFRADVTKTRRDGSKGALRIDYGNGREPQEPVKWLWKYIDGAKTAGELYGRALVVIAAEQYASRLVVPQSQRTPAIRWSSHKDLAAKALAKLTTSHLPASLRQLEAAVKRAHEERDGATQRARRAATRRARRAEVGAEDSAAGAADQEATDAEVEESDETEQ